MDDIDIALGGAIGYTLGEQAEREQSAEAIRKWFKGLPESTRARLIPLNPQIAEALMGENNGHTLHGDYMFELPPPPARIHPPKWTPREPRTRIRVGGFFAIMVAIVFNFTGLMLQLPGRALVLVSDALCKWAIVEEDE